MRIDVFYNSGFLTIFRRLRFSVSLIFFGLFLLCVLFYAFQENEGFNIVGSSIGFAKMLLLLVSPLVFLCLCYIYILKQNNPLFILFILIAMVLLVVVWFFSLGVELLSVLFLIIYIGAIAILFLFVIMLFDIRKVPYYAWSFYSWKGFLIAQKFIISFFLPCRTIVFFVYDCFMRILFQGSLFMSSLIFVLLSVNLIYSIYLCFYQVITFSLYFTTVSFPANSLLGIPIISHSSYASLSYLDYFFFYKNFLASFNLVVVDRFSFLFINFYVCLVLLLLYASFFAYETFLYGLGSFLTNVPLNLTLKLVDVVISYYWVLFGASCVVLYCFDFVDVMLLLNDNNGGVILGWQSLTEPSLSFATLFSEINIIFISLFQDNIFFLFTIMLILLSSLISAVFICTVFF